MRRRDDLKWFEKNSRALIYRQFLYFGINFGIQQKVALITKCQKFVADTKDSECQEVNLNRFDYIK